MITIHIYYRGENDNARKFAEKMTALGIVDQIRAKDGNLQYDYFFPMADAQTVLLIDSWKDQAAIDEHHASPIMQTIKALREEFDLHMTVERYLLDEQNQHIDREHIRV